MTVDSTNNGHRPVETSMVDGDVGVVIPLPGRANGPTPSRMPGTALVPDEAIEGELVTEDESRALDHRGASWRRVVPATAARTVQVVRVIRDPQTRSGRTSRAVVRHGLTVALGVGSWTRRAWDAGTMGVYRRQIKAAEAAGNQELLAEWTDRKEQAAERRHRRLLDLPTLAIGVVKAALGALLGLLALVLVVAVLAQLSGIGRFGGVLAGVLTGVGWLFAVIAFLWTPFLLGGPFLLVLAAWREGTRRGAAPGWLLAGQSTQEGGVLLTADGIARALQHLNIGPLNKAVKDGWIPRFDLVPTREGSGAFKGYRAIFDLPMGVTPGMIADRIDVFATNLHRTAVEVWPADHGREKGGKAGFVNLYVADSGVMDKPTPSYPLMHEGSADVFAGVPVGITQRGDTVAFPIVGSNFVFGGQPGQGKSNAGRVVMAGCALDPLAELRVHVFAGNGDFDAYQQRLSRYQKGATPEHAAQATEHLRELFDEVGRREERLAELGAKKLTRQIAQQHRAMRPIVVMFSECHELFGDKDCGKEAAELAVRVVKRGRKTGVTMGFDTQSSRTDAIPSQLVENVGVNGCFAVKAWRSNDGFLGDGSFAAGIRATELRFNIDRGTMVATGVSPELFEIVRTFFIEVNDDTGWDAATDIIDRAVAQIAPGTPIDGDRPTPTVDREERDPLTDILTVLGAQDRMRTQEVLQHLTEQHRTVYGGWTFADLKAALPDSAKPYKTSGGMHIGRQRLLDAITESDHEDPVDDSDE